MYKSPSGAYLTENASHSIDFNEPRITEPSCDDSAGKNCFSLRLIIQLFGSATDQDFADIIQVVQELLKNGVVEEASLGNENALIIDDVNNNSTATDGNQSKTPSQGMSAGMKVAISFIVIAAVVFIASAICCVLRKKAQQKDINLGDEEEGYDESNPPLKSEDRHRLA